MIEFIKKLFAKPVPIEENKIVSYPVTLHYKVKASSYKDLIIYELECDCIFKGTKLRKVRYIEKPSSLIGDGASLDRIKFHLRFNDKCDITYDLSKKELDMYFEEAKKLIETHVLYTNNSGGFKKIFE